MDGSIEIKDLKKIYKATESVKGVRNISYVRGRFMGEKSWVDVEIEVSSNVNVERADEISMEVRRSIEGAVDHLGEVSPGAWPCSCIDRR